MKDMDDFDININSLGGRKISRAQRSVRRHDTPDPTPTPDFDEAEPKIETVVVDSYDSGLDGKPTGSGGSDKLRAPQQRKRKNDAKRSKRAQPADNLQDDIDVQTPRYARGGVLSVLKDRRLHVFVGLFLIIVGAAMAISLVSHLRTAAVDQAKVLNQTVMQMASSSEGAKNTAGPFGAWLSHALFNDALGLGSFVIAVYLLVCGACVVAKLRLHFWAFTFKSLLLAVSVSVVAGLVTYQADTAVYWGGTHGHQANAFLFGTAGVVGAYGVALLLTAAVVCVFYHPIRKAGAKFCKIMPSLKMPSAPAVHSQSQDGRETVAAPGHKNDAGLTGDQGAVVDNCASSGLPDGDNAVNAEEVAGHDDLQPDVTSARDRAFSIDSDDDLVDVDENNHDRSAGHYGNIIAENDEEQSANRQATRITGLENADPLDRLVDNASPHDNLNRDNDTGAATAAGVRPVSKPDTTIKIAQAEVVDARGTVEGPRPMGDNAIDHRATMAYFNMPPLDLLHERPVKRTADIDNQQQNMDRIVKTLADYRINVSKIMATVGPTVTLYEIIPVEGTRISQIARLEADIAMALSAKAIRIIAPMPGKGTVGIEVPNSDPQTVSMRTMLASKRFRENTKALPVALGATISNEVFVADVASMPHALVAGATGQGKSVGLNAMIASLLYKKHPTELKFVMIDPKMVEFSLYAKIEKSYIAKLPDQEDPIITDSNRVLDVLKSLCVEMDQRYLLLKAAFVRDVESYNKRFEQGRLSTEDGHKYLPYIVLVIDEFADLIMVGGKEIENPIIRLTQKARAVGIHLIIATQRPSTNVLTGLIKANCPARIAFRVNQMVDSRCILDRPGANQLIGRGDMLYSSAGGGMERMQCAFISTEEVEALVDHIAAQPGVDTYILPDPALADMPEGNNGNGMTAAGDIHGANFSGDPLFKDSAYFFAGQGPGSKPSTSSLQRRFSIGYNRAGKIIDMLEAAGIVSASHGTPPVRSLLVDVEYLDRLFGS